MIATADTPLAVIVHTTSSILKHCDITQITTEHSPPMYPQPKPLNTEQEEFLLVEHRRFLTRQERQRRDWTAKDKRNRRRVMRVSRRQKRMAPKKGRR